MTNEHDFNNAKEQRNFDVIPTGTIVALQLTIRPGNAGEDGWLKRSKDGRSEGLDIEFTVVDGDYAKRKIWTLFTLNGETDGHNAAAEISRAKLRAILESARGVRPDDRSDAAAQARRIDGLGDLDGLRFVAKIGVEPARNGYPAKNVLLEIVTPERRDWRAVEQAAKSAKPVAAAAQAAPPTSAVIERPAWAR